MIEYETSDGVKRFTTSLKSIAGSITGQERYLTYTNRPGNKPAQANCERKKLVLAMMELGKASESEINECIKDKLK